MRLVSPVVALGGLARTSSRDDGGLCVRGTIARAEVGPFGKLRAGLGDTTHGCHNFVVPPLVGSLCR
jgi:hypothetical protein